MAALVLSKCAHRVFKMCKRERTPKRCSCFMSAPPGQERVAFRVTHFSLMISHAIADEFQGVFSNVWFSQTYPDKHSRREKSVWGGRLPLGRLAPRRSSAAETNPVPEGLIWLLRILECQASQIMKLFSRPIVWRSLYEMIRPFGNSCKRRSPKVHVLKFGIYYHERHNSRTPNPGYHADLKTQPNLSYPNPPLLAPRANLLKVQH